MLADGQGDRVWGVWPRDAIYHRQIAHCVMLGTIVTLSSSHTAGSRARGQQNIWSLKLLLLWKMESTLSLPVASVSYSSNLNTASPPDLCLPSLLWWIGFKSRLPSAPQHQPESCSVKTWILVPDCLAKWTLAQTLNREWLLLCEKLSMMGPKYVIIGWLIRNLAGWLICDLYLVIIGKSY